MSGMLTGMELDLENQPAECAYPILASLVTPRPSASLTSWAPTLPFWQLLPAIAKTAPQRIRREISV
jgi:hypothetical protein